ncbi:unnamed protein product [Spirodela intermedia]|uniref:Uncharacterized protein n=1 Tax=Spirodela intermedia TaxID=51605 RepID=A0ABN7EDJ5_SPIIN|nr:unnamed protein product [Spirodela intermedia]
MKWVVESSPAAVTRRSGKTATLRLSGGCHPTERGWMEEVATGLPADRPLPDDGLFVDQSEMIYSMDCDPFIANPMSTSRFNQHLLARGEYRAQASAYCMCSERVCHLIPFT